MDDVNGRKYARISELAAGDLVQVDDGFEGCFVPWSKLPVVEVNGELALIHNDPKCGACGGEKEGDCSHTLDEQIADDGDSLVGIYKVL